VPPVEAWKKVLVSEDFAATSHGQYDCTHCHGGQGEEQEMEAAHEGMEVDPSDGCAQCHAVEAHRFEQSQHSQLTGYRKLIAARAGVDEMTPGLEEMFEQNCNKCHATCGQCHISRPNSVKKGFVRGHKFLSRPSMVENCTACHGSRIGQEFRGQHEGIPADTHYSKGMQCVACHSADELHGHGEQGDTRYEVEMAPKCEDCHSIGDDNLQHKLHAEKVACQVCHSVTYKNCYSCHVGHGLERPSEMDFKIGLNPLRSDERPYEYVVVRHIPIAPDSYRDYEPGGLPNFSVLPTWKYATPHNIQRRTPQTANCTDSCHNNAEIFLTEADMADLPPEEVEATRNVVVREIP